LIIERKVSWVKGPPVFLTVELNEKKHKPERRT
jgi:hypothetical protein